MALDPLLLIGLALLAQAKPAEDAPAGGRSTWGARPHCSSSKASNLETALVESRWPRVLIEFNRKGFSTVYSTPFSDPKLFPRLLEGTSWALGVAKLGKVAVNSFCAGFGGVRELLKVPEHLERIDCVVLGDSAISDLEKSLQSQLDGDLKMNASELV